jgi:hypothetical protein
MTVARYSSQVRVDIEHLISVEFNGCAANGNSFGCSGGSDVLSTQWPFSRIEPSSISVKVLEGKSIPWGAAPVAGATIGGLVVSAAATLVLWSEEHDASAKPIIEIATGDRRMRTALSLVIGSIPMTFLLASSCPANVPR